jgi:hypothetical protein
MLGRQPTHVLARRFAARPAQLTLFADVLPCRKSLQDDLWAPADWVEAAQPVADFLHLLVTRFPEKRANRAAEVAECLAALRALAEELGVGEPRQGMLALRRSLEKLSK